MGGHPEGRGPAPGARPLSDPGPGTGPAAPRPVVRVQPDVAGVPGTFDYEVPERLGTGLEVGTRVRVRLGGRPMGGWVIEADPDPPPGIVLRPLVAVSGRGPSTEVIELARWAAWRWAGPLAPLLRSASPSANVTVLPEAPVLGDPDPRPGEAEAWTAPAESAARAVLGAEGPALVRLPPVADLLPLVLAALDAHGPGLLVLVPSAGWAERMVARLAHRGVPATQVTDAAGWARATAGWPVVVGSRGAAWAPRPRLAAAVVLDVHDEAYRSGWPAYDAGEVVAERARRAGVPAVWVSACPRPVQAVRGVRWAPARHVEASGWAPLVVVDGRAGDPRRSILSDELSALGRRTLAAGRRFVCVLDRTGRARLLACAACGELARCEHCGRRLVQLDDGLGCTGCGRQRPAVCAACGATRLKVLRPGVGRVGQELEGVLGTAVGEVAGPARGAPEVPDEAVLVGTQAVLHRVRRAGAVAFVDFDQHLLAPRVGAEEEAMALLARASRIVGGRGDPGAWRPAVLVQTRLPEHPVLRAALRGDPAAQSGHDLGLRAELDLPPYVALASMSGPGAPGFAAALERPGVVVAPLEPDRFLARANDADTLCDALAATPRPAQGLRVVVDPDDL